MILICDLCTTKYGLKTALKKLRKHKEAQGSRKSWEILCLGCLFEVSCICKKAGSICRKIFQKHSSFKAYIVSKNCALAADIFTYDDHELDRILESMNWDEYKFIDLPVEQHDDSSQGHTGIGMAPTLDTSRCWGSQSVKGVQWNCVQKLTLARGVLCPLPIERRLLVPGYKNGSAKLFSACASKIDPLWI